MFISIFKKVEHGLNVHLFGNKKKYAAIKREGFIHPNMEWSKTCCQVKKKKVRLFMLRQPKKITYITYIHIYALKCIHKGLKECDPWWPLGFTLHNSVI